MAEISKRLDDPEESWIVADEERRMEEGSAVDGEIPKEAREAPEMDLEKSLRIQFDCVGEVRNPQAQQPCEHDFLVRAMQEITEDTMGYRCHDVLPALDAKGAAVARGFTVGHVHIAELDRNVALDTKQYMRSVCVPRYMKTLSNDNGLLELAKYFSETLPITNMNIP
jgi:hypothetical protein